MSDVRGGTPFPLVVFCTKNATQPGKMSGRISSFKSNVLFREDGSMRSQTSNGSLPMFNGVSFPIRRCQPCNHNLHAEDRILVKCIALIGIPV